MVIEVKEVQFSNALIPIFVTLLPIVTLVRLVQPWNVFSSILVTLLGIVTLVMVVQL